jgi:hypothetical protein
LGATSVNAEEIRQMRDLLAAQPAMSAQQPSGLRGKLTTFLGRKPAAPCAMPPVADAAPVAPEPEDLVLAADPAPCDPIPPELLLGDLAPRRPAFGQRAERVLELNDVAPEEPRRLILCAAGGEAVGEIILRGGGGGALHAEAPFFPEDLADDAFPRPKRQPDKARTHEPPPPAPELAGTFLLANLAARLASEEAALSRRLTAARGLAEAA